MPTWPAFITWARENLSLERVGEGIGWPVRRVYVWGLVCRPKFLAVDGVALGGTIPPHT